MSDIHKYVIVKVLGKEVTRVEWFWGKITLAALCRLLGQGKEGARERFPEENDET